MMNLIQNPNNPVVPGVPVKIALTSLTPTVMFAGVVSVPKAEPFSAVVRIVVMSVPFSVIVINWPSTGSPVLSSKMT